MGLREEGNLMKRGFLGVANIFSDLLMFLRVVEGIRCGHFISFPSLGYAPNGVYYVVSFALPHGPSRIR
jgi:hypothetical protein